MQIVGPTWLYLGTWPCVSWSEGQHGLYFMAQWFCLISWRLSDVCTSYFQSMNQYDPTFDLKINVGDCHLYFTVQWLCLISWRLFHVWTSFFLDYESVWPDAWPKNKYRSPWPIFHGPVILPYILTTIWCIYISFFRSKNQYDLTFDLKINVGHCVLYFIVQWLCLIPWRLFHVWTSLFGIINHYDPMHHLKINVGHHDLYFMVQ